MSPPSPTHLIATAASAVGNKEMEALKKQLAEKDKALGGMQKQLELMNTSQVQAMRDEFESEKARMIEEMEARHAAKRTAFDVMRIELHLMVVDLGDLEEMLL